MPDKKREDILLSDLITKSSNVKNVVKSSKKQKQKTSFKKIASFSIVFLICTFLFGSVGAFMLLNSNHTNVKAIIKDITAAPESVNILLAGKDNDIASGFLLIKLDFKNHTMPVLLLPNETNVNVNEHSDTLLGQMNYGGIKQAANAVASYLSVDVNYYAVISDTLLQTMVDKLGGVDFPVHSLISYTLRGQTVPTTIAPGNHHLTGTMVLGLLRSNTSNKTEKYTNLKNLTAAIINQYSNKNMIEQAQSLYNMSVDKMETNITSQVFFNLMPAIESCLITYKNPAYIVDNGGVFVTATSTGNNFYSFNISDKIKKNIALIYK